MTTELKYDPELPFVVYAPGSNEINSRFKYENEAITHLGTATWLKVIDTTPKPKIPEDANYLIWELDGETNMAYRDDGEWFGTNQWWTHKELMDVLKDAEVTVLVRKEDS